MELISIALATYNGEKYLSEQLDSIVSQTYNNIEIIIQDDCSSDNTIGIVKEYAQKDNRIHFAVNEKNLGFTQNFESSIRKCNGKYIAFCDQDDIWMINHIELLYYYIQGYDVSCGNSLLVDEYDTSLDYTMMEVTGIKNNISKEEVKYRLFYDNFVQGSAMMVKKELCVDCLPIPEVIKFHDYWLALIASMGNRVIYTNEVVLHYRQHGANVTSNITNPWWRKIYNSINGYNKKHSRHQVEILKCLQKYFSNDIDIKEAITFFESHSLRKINSFSKKYYYERLKDTVNSTKFEWLVDLFYLYINI